MDVVGLQELYSASVSLILDDLNIAIQPEVSERSELAFWKTSILAMNPAKWLKVDGSIHYYATLTHPFRLDHFTRFACPSLKMHTISLRSAQLDFEKKRDKSTSSTRLELNKLLEENPKIRKRIEEVEKWDLMIFEWARARLCGQIKELREGGGNKALFDVIEHEGEGLRKVDDFCSQEQVIL